MILMMLDFESVMLMIGCDVGVLVGDVGFWVGDADDWWLCWILGRCC